MNILLQTTKPHLYRAAIRLIFIHLLAINCEENANAETIWVESETQIISDFDFQTAPGGILSLTLLDDLFHPIPDVPVRVELQSSSSDQNYRYSVTTGNNGKTYTLLKLPPDSYHGYAEFSGKNSWRAARLELAFEIKRCFSQMHTNPEFPLAIPTGETMRFELVRNACHNLPADYRIALSSISQNVHFSKGENRGEVQLNPYQETPAILDMDITLAKGEYLEPEELHAKVVVYEDLFENPPVYIQNWRQSSFIAKLREETSFIPVTLELTSETAESIQMPANPNSHGNLQFIPPKDLSGCYSAHLFRSDLWQDRGDWTGEICVIENKGRFLLPTIGLVVIIAGFFAILYRPRRKKRHLPPKLTKCSMLVTSTPIAKKLSNATPPNHEPDRCELICTDAVSRVPISPNELQIKLNGTPIAITEWPLELIDSTHVEITGKRYLSWSGKLKKCRQNTILLTSRRDYAIQCFETVCEFQHKEFKTWGHETPIQLAECIQKKAPQKKEQAERFSELLSSAAFDDGDIDDEMLKEMRMLAKILST